MTLFAAFHLCPLSLIRPHVSSSFRRRYYEAKLAAVAKAARDDAAAHARALQSAQVFSSKIKTNSDRVSDIFSTLFCKNSANLVSQPPYFYSLCHLHIDLKSGHRTPRTQRHARAGRRRAPDGRGRTPGYARSEMQEAMIVTTIAAIFPIIVHFPPHTPHINKLGWVEHQALVSPRFQKRS